MHKAVIEVELSSDDEAKALYTSLKPEVLAMSSRGLMANISTDTNKVEITIEAVSLSKLRAALNSYLRWIHSFGELAAWVSSAGERQ
ncbi:MAG: KEOPS complex subunit Pcc1 [Candidatus Nezhaarchaeota archaeon]|nr:KEOPS complex subunit Pcc1 [Candidatus Nezhaarchaeota archaeon]